MTTTTSTASSSRDDRFLRQRDLVPTDVIATTPVTVIGVGAIGRQVALQLAALGVGQVQLIDFDRVALHNITSQGYRQRDIGAPKAVAAAAAIAEIDASISVEAVCDRFRPRQSHAHIVYCCVDSISARTAIWNHLQRRSAFWVDGRMLGETIRVLTAADDSSRTAYRNSLFAPTEAQTGSCTARSTIYAANIAAALMVHQFTRWVRRLPLDDDLSLNLLSSELSVV